MTFQITRIAAILTFSLVALCAYGILARTAPGGTMGLQPDGRYLVPTNQTVRPTGIVRRIDGARPKDLAVSPDGQMVAVLCTNRVAFFSAQGERLDEMSIQPAALGIAWSPDSHTLYVSGARGRVLRLRRLVLRWKRDGDLPVEDSPADAAPSGPGASSPNRAGQMGRVSDGKQVELSPNPEIAGLAVSPDGRRLYAALGIRNRVAVVDLEQERVVSSLPVGVAPRNVLLSPDGGTLFVANRGGHAPSASDHSEPSAGSPVRVDPATDAARGGSITVVDTETFQTREIEVGRQPSGMALSRDCQTLYVASSDDDRVYSVRVDSGVATELPSPDSLIHYGAMPTSCALADDGQALYTACGGANRVVEYRLVDRSDASMRTLSTGWFPIAVAQRSGMLYIASAKGIGARPENAPKGYGVHSSVGVVQFVPLNGQTAFQPAEDALPALPRRITALPVPVPERLGEPSVFKHVVYVIKENHTYDLDLGDMPEGNGDKALTLFGEQVTPNEHALAREFVLLDNTYTSGTNSADGHQWVDSAAANAYTEQNYSANIRSYPFDGGDPLAYSPRGFLWNAVKRRGLSEHVYGEFVNKPEVMDPDTGKQPTWTQLWQEYQSGTHHYRIHPHTDCAALRPFLRDWYVGWPITVSDQYRASLFLEDMAQWERNGGMPSFCMLLLPCDHTTGTDPGYPKPRSMVADNDLALGRIVDGISHSRFWKDTLILVIEDDSQFGLDHVDGHRTVAQCISAYTRRHAVVSEPYNHTSFARTIELVLGLSPMTRFDASATPLTACFTSTPEFTPYTYRPNRVPLDDMNPQPRALHGETRRLARASGRQDWSSMDRARPDVVARAAWHAAHPHTPFPASRFSADDDD